MSLENRRLTNRVKRITYPSNTHSSQGDSVVPFFEDNEAVIKMIIKGRSPTGGKARPTNLDLHGQCKEDGSLVNPWNDNDRRRVGLASGNWRHSGSNFEFENSQVNRRENVYLAHRKPGQKDQTRAKSEEDSSRTRTVDASSPESENIRFSNHRYLGKIFQCIQKKLGRSAIDATFSIQYLETNVLTRAEFQQEFGNLQEHEIRGYWEWVQQYSIFKEHSEETLNARSLQFSSPSCEINFGQATACVYADSVPCVGLMEQGPGAAERRLNGQVEGLRLYSSCQDAVGLDGEPIEFEWTIFPGFSLFSLLREIQNDLKTTNIKPEDFKDRNIFMSMFSDVVWKKKDEICTPNAEEVRNYAMRFVQAHWTFLSPGSQKWWYCDSHGGQWDRTANKMVQQCREFGHPIFTSTSALSRGILKQRGGWSTAHFNGEFCEYGTLVSDSSFRKSNQYLFGLPGGTRRSGNAGVSSELGTWKQDVRKRSFRKKEKRVQMAQLCETALFQHLVTAENCNQIPHDDKDGWEKLLYAEIKRVLEFIWKPKHWQLFPQVRVLDQSLKFMLWISWRTWIRGFDSINLQARGRNLRCDIKRDWALCERNS